jgi:phosphate uptake regulator
MMFIEAHNSLQKVEERYPTKVTIIERELKKDYEQLKERLMDKELTRKEVIVALISARILKRIAGHHDNIATSGARPFPKLGFKPGASSWED